MSNHENHHAHDIKQITMKSDDSCCSDTDDSKSSGQHMMHHMMSVSYLNYILCTVVISFEKIR